MNPFNFKSIENGSSSGRVGGWVGVGWGGDDSAGGFKGAVDMRGRGGGERDEGRS